MTAAAILKIDFLAITHRLIVRLQRNRTILQRYGDLAIFKMAAVRHLRFVMTSQYCIAGHKYCPEISC